MVVVAQRVQKAAGPTRTEKQGEGAAELVCLGRAVSPTGCLIQGLIFKYALYWMFEWIKYKQTIELLAQAKANLQDGSIKSN